MNPSHPSRSRASLGLQAPPYTVQPSRDSRTPVGEPQTPAAPAGVTPSLKPGRSMRTTHSSAPLPLPVGRAPAETEDGVFVALAGDSCHPGPLPSARAPAKSFPATDQGVSSGPGFTPHLPPVTVTIHLDTPNALNSVLVLRCNAFFPVPLRGILPQPCAGPLVSRKQPPECDLRAPGFLPTRLSLPASTNLRALRQPPPGFPLLLHGPYPAHGTITAAGAV